MAKLSSDKTYVTVEKGDCLSQIAEDFSDESGGKTYPQLAELNGIQDPDLIYVGQKIRLTGEKTTTKASTTSKVTITAFGLQSNSDSNIFATWTWTKSNTDHYECMWYYDTGDGVWFVGSDSDETYKQSVYNHPANAKRVKFKVKPVSKTHKVNGKDTSYWTGSWSTEKIYDVVNQSPPQTPGTPSVTLEDFTLTCKLTNIDVAEINAKQIQFTIRKDESKTFKTATVKIDGTYDYANVSYACKVDAGSKYDVCARSVRNKLYSEWSEWSDVISTKPSAPTKITKCKRLTESTVYLEWTKVDSADSYTIRYATEKSDYLTNSNLSTTVDVEENCYTLGGLDGGETYFFQVCAVNDAGESDYCSYVSVAVGEAPEAPTTWSSTTTYIWDEDNPEPLSLYWVHNSKDGSSQTAVKLNFETCETYDDDDLQSSLAKYKYNGTELPGIPTSTFRYRTILYIDSEYYRVIFSDEAPVVEAVDNYGDKAITWDTTSSTSIVYTYNPDSDEYWTVDEDEVPTFYESYSYKWIWSSHTIYDESGTAVHTASEPVLVEYGITYTFTTDVVEDEESDIIHSDSERILKFISKYVYDPYDTVYWQVQTAGVTGEFSEWSIRRSIKVYSRPTLDLRVTNNDGDAFSELVSFPINVYGLTSPSSQKPISYHLTIKANDSYETVDDLGNVKMVLKDDLVFSRHYDISTALDVSLSAYDVDLENNINYTIACTVTMNSGLDATAEEEFTVNWTDSIYEPNAEISIDYDTLVAYIKPYCVDENEEPIENVSLSVYRRQYDGSFVEIIKNVENGNDVVAVDPHPALDYARYRIVAISKDTGSVSYCDLPGYPVGVSSVIIQWDDAWSTFDVADEGVLETPPWTGSLVKLPYNIDVNEGPRKDVSLIEYIGREHPVSYYGTQRGESASWKTEIDKNDNETIYALRRLAVWAGDAYVREPSGVGYWANITVTLDRQHCAVTIPVSFSITRVEGGA